jgi:GGDEF domain-containing protein
MYIQWAVVLWLFIWCARLSKRQRRLDAISLYDGLTGLLCGRVFERERWPAAIRDSSPVAFLYVDLDDLKAAKQLGRR